MMDIDFGKTAQDYRRYRAGFPEAFFDRLSASFKIGHPGQKLLDVGTGTGTLARGFALRGCEVTGLDPSENLVEQAKMLDAEANVSIAYVIRRTEETLFPDATFDVVSAGQCWHWFERHKAASEILRILKPGGVLVIAHFDWVPLPGNVVDATEQLILKHNTSWSLSGGYGMYPPWLADVGMAGFKQIETFTFDVDVPYTHEGWRGRIRASAGVAASLSLQDIETFDQAHQSLLSTHFPEDPLAVPHRIFTLICRKPNTHP